MSGQTDNNNAESMKVQLLPSGDVSPKGKTPFLVDEDARGLILESFGAGRGELVIDYEHQSLSGSEAPAAGWVRGLEDRGEDGVWAEVEWTERAAGYIMDGEYRYISPVVLIRKSDGRAVELIGAALTNLPAIEGMAPIEFVTAEDGVEADAEADDAGTGYREMYFGLLEALGLGPDAEYSEITAKVAPVTEPDAYVSRAVYDELERRLKENEAETLVSCACTEGKITPALVPWARAYAMSDPEGFRAFAAKAAPVACLSGDVTDDAIPADPSQSAVNAMLGISGRAYARYGRV